MKNAAPSTRKWMKIAHNALQKNKGQEAFDALRQVLQLNPNHAEALYHTGFLLHGTGKYAQAGEYYQRAIQADPTHLESYLMYCKLLEAQNRAQEAIQLAQHTVQTLPHEAQAHCQYVSTLMRFSQTHRVPEYLETILPQFPTHTELHQFYCFSLKANDRFEEADRAYAALLAAHRVPASFRILYETLLPRFYQSATQIDAARAALEQSIERFIAEKPRVPIGMLSNYPLFALAYHNRDNKNLMQLYTRMLRLIAPELNYTAAHCKSAKPRAEGPLRIGFISNHMHNHSVGNCYRHVMLYLAAQPEFSVTFFNLADVMDSKIQEIMDANVPIVPLPRNLPLAHEKVASHALDILIYPDIGMEAQTHYMAMARLAPHQVCLGGHPETTGIDTVDYVVASRTYEPEHADENYTERLLCVDGINYIFARPATPERWLTREELGLPADKKLYICPMAVQKLHPDFDAVLAAILAADPNAVVVLFNDFQQESATQNMQARLLKQCDATRVLFMPWLPLASLFSVLKLADAVLDTIYFGGGTTAHYAFAFGVPIVTMPGHYARGRCVASYYEVMEIDDAPIASTVEEYVACAVKLANDVEYARHLHTQILERNPRIFETAPYGPIAAQLMKDIAAQHLAAYARLPVKG